MNSSWKIAKIAIAVVAIVGAVIWAMNTTQSQSFSGTNLTFPMGSGPVTITNPSEEAIAVQLVGPTTRTFSVASPTEGLTRAATRQGTGSASTYLYEMSLLPGDTELTITRGSNVNFVAITDTILSAISKPVTDDFARTILLLTTAFIALALFYISRVLEHSWIKQFLPAKVVPATSSQPVQTAQGGVGHSYGDNRTKS